MPPCQFSILGKCLPCCIDMGLLMHANLEAIACCATLTAGGQPYRSTKVETFDAERSNLSSTIAA